MISFNNTQDLSAAEIRYLLAIYQLGKGICAVRSVDVAGSLGVSRASVSKMLHSLTERELIFKEYYSNIRLTRCGAYHAELLFCRFCRLEKFFREGLGLEAGQARQDATACLYALSAEAAEKLALLASGD